MVAFAEKKLPKKKRYDWKWEKKMVWEAHFNYDPWQGDKKCEKNIENSLF